MFSGGAWSSLELGSISKLLAAVSGTQQMFVTSHLAVPPLPAPGMCPVSLTLCLPRCRATGQLGSLLLVALPWTSCRHMSVFGSTKKQRGGFVKWKQPPDPVSGRKRPHDAQAPASPLCLWCAHRWVAVVLPWSGAHNAPSMQASAQPQCVYMQMETGPGNGRLWKFLRADKRRTDSFTL